MNETHAETKSINWQETDRGGARAQFGSHTLSIFLRWRQWRWSIYEPNGRRGGSFVVGGCGKDRLDCQGKIVGWLIAKGLLKPPAVKVETTKPTVLSVLDGAVRQLLDLQVLLAAVAEPQDVVFAPSTDAVDLVHFAKEVAGPGCDGAITSLLGADYSAADPVLRHLAAALKTEWAAVGKMLREAAT